MSRDLIPKLVYIIVAAVSLSGAFRALSQSVSLEGKIEGIVLDANGAVVPDASVSAFNLNTGQSRTTRSNQEGTYRFPLISPGQYVITAEANGFKRFERRGVNLSAGETGIVDISLEAGNPSESVAVTFDTAIADPSRFAVGRNLNSRDVNNLPLVSRNPYNFILLQPGVNGREVTNPNVIDMSVAGLRRRVGYQIDGSDNNDYNASGFRLDFLSEIFIQEMQLLSTNYPAEYGDTAGAIVNVITRSGSNNTNGSLSFIYRPSALTAKPFGSQPGTGTNVNAYGGTAAVGGAIIKDRWHIFAAYEWTRRNSIQPISVAPENRTRLIDTGLPPSIFINKLPLSDTLPYLSVRTDASVSGSTRVSLRYNNFVSGLKHSGPGGVLTTERSFGFSGYAYALAAQAVTTFSPTLFSEFHFQDATHITRTIADEQQSGRGPTVTITNVAAFGPDPNLGVISPSESTVQFQETITRIAGNHTFKFGGGMNFIEDHPAAQLASQYTFSRIEDYISAVSGTTPQSYQRYQESTGDNAIPDSGTFSNLFAQDEWIISRRARLSVGVRYELFRPPEFDPAAVLPASRKFNIDTNNIAPRVGFTYLLRNGKFRTVVRVGGGVHYDPPLLGMYRRALLNNGNPRYGSFTLTPCHCSATPNFPNRLGTVQPPKDLDAVAQDFQTMYAIRSSVQIEQAVSNESSITIGYINSIARHIPVYRNINCLPTGVTLADGRPIYGAGPNRCINKVYPQYNIIKMAESVGNQNYQGLFVQWMQRFSHGIQVNVNYTFSHSIDDAPEENGPGALTSSDPSNRGTDRGASRGDIANVLNLSLVLRPQFHFENAFLNTLLNHNQIGVIMIADSGEAFNITTGDLNLDGVTGPAGPDRPVGILRNSGRLPAYIGVDTRYSRYFGLSEKRSLEFYIEATNLFNKKQVDGYDGANLPLSLVDLATGILRVQLPDRSTLLPTWRDSRQVQLGIKFHF